MIITQIVYQENKENVKIPAKQIGKEKQQLKQNYVEQQQQPQINQQKDNKKKSSIIENAIQQANALSQKNYIQKKKQSLNKQFCDMSLEESPKKEKQTTDKIQLFEKSYSNQYDENLLENEPDFSNCLRHTQIKESLRAKMVDWIIEVYGNYNNTCNHETFFRAVAIMDLFLKKTTINYMNNDLHLIGISSMFIATKMEDIYHIPLQDFVMRVGHGKYSCTNIKEQEWEILNTLKFLVDFPTSYQFLIRYCYKIFNSFDTDYYQPIVDSAIYLLKQCLHDYKSLNIKPHIISLAVLQLSITTYFDTVDNQFNLQGEEVLRSLSIQRNQQAQIEKNLQNILIENEINHFNEALNQVRKLTMNFALYYPSLINLEKFCL